MLSWLGLSTHNNRIQPFNSEKPMINKKVGPTVRSTPVNVIIDDTIHSNVLLPLSDTDDTLIKPYNSASISLSFELAKRDSITINKPNRIITQKPDYAYSSPTNSYSSSLLSKIGHSPKATTTTNPTSVSVRGCVYEMHLQYDSVSVNESSSIRSSAAIESLTKRIENVPSTPTSPDMRRDSILADDKNNNDNIHQREDAPTYANNMSINDLNETALTSFTCKKVRKDGKSRWSWLRFSFTNDEAIVINTDMIVNDLDIHSNNKEQILNHSLNSKSPNTNLTTESIVISSITTPTDKNTRISRRHTSYSWTSYLFINREKHLIKHDKPTQQMTNTAINKVIEEKYHSHPKTVNRRLQEKESVSRTPVKKGKNSVLPLFESQFIPIPDHSQSVPHHNSSNIITKALEVLNSFITHIPHEQPEDTSHWIAAKMKNKFSRFIEDMKSCDPRTINEKRIAIVGVHGWFPMKLVRSMIGEPTGTSAKFCEQMKTAIKLYFQSEHEINIPEAAVTMIPLEGEGKVENRVDDLYSTLINHSDWLEAISSADVILWATHSQGTPVSFLLLQRLLERGHIHVTRQSVCISAMAGISHGPFPTLKASLIVKYFEADAARELFDFMDPNSKISIKYTQALAYVLKGGVKVVLTGSMQDQVVPFYSAIVTGVNHPNILRSVFIDHHLYAKDDFLINLVVFAIQLRNAGLSDHNLLVYLSDVLAGSIYSIEGGHSTVYEEVEVYMTAVKYVFQTAPFGKHVRYFSPECIIQRPPFLKTQSYSHLPSISSSADTSSQAEEPHMDHFQAQLQINPYYLPWVMHAICSDQRILADEVLKGALLRVLALFKVWEPASSRLKELKFRLDPISTIRI